MIGRDGRFLGDLLSHGLSILALSIVVYRAWLKMLDAYEYGNATNMLSLPIRPFYGMIAILTPVLQATPCRSNGVWSR